MKVISISVKYSTKKVNLTYKALRVGLTVRDDSDLRSTAEPISYKDALKLVKSGQAVVKNENLIRSDYITLCSALKSGVVMGRLMDVNKKIKQLKEHGDHTWFDSLAVWLDVCDKSLPKSGVKL